MRSPLCSTAVISVCTISSGISRKPSINFPKPPSIVKRGPLCLFAIAPRVTERYLASHSFKMGKQASTERVSRSPAKIPFTIGSIKSSATLFPKRRLAKVPSVSSDRFGFIKTSRKMPRRKTRPREVENNSRRFVGNFCNCPPKRTYLVFALGDASTVVRPSVCTTSRSSLAPLVRNVRGPFSKK